MMNEQLSQAEWSELQRREAIIKHGLKAFYEVGEALLGIRDQRLYRGTHPTFEDYCQQRWQISKTHANRLIAGYDVVHNLKDVIDIDLLPVTERQARELVGLTTEEARLIVQVAKEIIPDGNASGPQLKSMVAVLKQATVTGALDDGEGESVRVADLLKAAITEETYERMKRQEAHIQERAKPRRYVLKATRVRLQHYSAHMITLTIMDKDVLEYLLNAPTDLILSLWSELDE